MALQLGPVIGTIGGKAEAPVEYGGSNIGATKTVTLPDGKWAVAVTIDRHADNSSGGVRVNGVSALTIVGNVTNVGKPTLLLRQQSGKITLMSVVVPIVSVTAFPEAD